MTRQCSVPTIPDQWSKSRKPLGLAAIAITLAICALLAVRLPAATDPLADLKAGAAALDAKHYAAAIAALNPLSKRLPKLADYAAWFLASAQFESQNFGDAVKAAEAA